MPASKATPDKVLPVYFRPKNSQVAAQGPAKIRCFCGGEWKPRSAFSNRQLEKFIASRVHPANSTISCRQHSSHQSRELQCEGPCGRWRPLEDFSKSTRSSGKNWCMDCTEWQLSMEPGFTPYVPPNSVSGPEEATYLEDGHGDIHFDNKAEDRVAEWIQGNPSEADDYDTLEIATQRSVADTASEISGLSLLDDSISGLGGLPQALNAMNLSRVGYINQAALPSYASVTSQSSKSTAVKRAQTKPSDTQSYSGSSAPTFVTDSTEVARTGDGSWMENEFIAVNTPADDDDTTPRRNWARPSHRRTDLFTPKYVISGNIYDAQVHQQTTYADVDDDGSEDEC